jgi:hypothetical protein
MKAAAEPTEPRRYPSAAAAAGETIRLPGGKELPRRRAASEEILGLSRLCYPRCMSNPLRYFNSSP